jgi:hypothetical protein
MIGRTCYGLLMELGLCMKTVDGNAMYFRSPSTILFDSLTSHGPHPVGFHHNLLASVKSQSQSQ